MFFAPIIELDLVLTFSQVAGIAVTCNRKYAGTFTVSILQRGPTVPLPDFIQYKEGRPVSSKSVYPRNSVWIANLDTECKHCTGLPGSPGIFVSGVVYLLCPNSLSKLKSGIDRF